MTVVACFYKLPPQAHIAFDYLNTKLKDEHPSVKLLSIIDAVALFCKGIHKASILGSNTTVNSQLYQKKLKEIGVENISLDASEQSVINQIISNGP